LTVCNIEKMRALNINAKNINLLPLLRISWKKSLDVYVVLGSIVVYLLRYQVYGLFIYKTTCPHPPAINYRNHVCRCICTKVGTNIKCLPTNLYVPKTKRWYVKCYYVQLTDNLFRIVFLAYTIL
jgi:hypothetical protein